MAEIAGAPSPHARFLAIAERLRARPAPKPRPASTEPSESQRLATALQPWLAQPAFSSFLHFLCERITVSHEATRAHLAVGAPTASFYGGYEAALTDLHAAILAWREGQPHDGPPPATEGS